jgi:hypothetical protein
MCYSIFMLSIENVFVVPIVSAQIGAGAAVMVVPWKKCPTLLFVDGLRCMAIETNYRKLRSLQ